MPEVTGTTLFQTLRELFPDLLPSITPEVLNKICKDPITQPFISWFCSNVTRDNVLSEADLQIKAHLEECGMWFKEDLTSQLNQAVQHCPELLQLLLSEPPDGIEHKLKYDMEKEKLAEDQAYLETIEETIRILKEEEEKLIDEIEYEEMLLQKDHVGLEECYRDCMDRLTDLDDVHKMLHCGVERLTYVYADAAELKGFPVTWTQLPLELCKNQTKMYINYLAAYIKRHFGHSSEDDQARDSDFDPLMEDSRDKRGEEMLQELSFCLRNLINPKIEEISSKVNVEAYAAMEELVIEIYNKGNPKLPQTQAELQLDIMEMSGRRDFLEENVRLLRDQRLEEAVTGSAELTIMRVVVHDAQARKERREQRLLNMLRLRELAREHGHAHSDLLCMLMELQFRQITNALEFIADARHYLTTEHSLASIREGVMQQLQSEYDTLSTLPGKKNIYNKIFISMMNGNINDKESMSTAWKEYDELVATNQENKNKIFNMYLDDKISRIMSVETDVDKIYKHETSNGPTVNLNLLPVDIAARMEEAKKSNIHLQEGLVTRRNRMKEKSQKRLTNFEWESTILWQRFVADPDSLARIYNEALEKVEQLHFARQQMESGFQ